MVFLDFFGKKKNNIVIIVSGLPRSGTSMMMKMLKVGGLCLLTDEERTADIDNPLGYFEYERVKKMADGDIAWVSNARGKVVKVISALLTLLPSDYTYKVLFMVRPIPEILASQKKMLSRRGIVQEKVGDDEMNRIFENHLDNIFHWIAGRKNISMLKVEYLNLISCPEDTLTSIFDFLDVKLDKEKMIEVVNLNLYRNRQTADNER